MNYYEAKFTRENKDRPMDWVIVPNGVGGYMVICIAPNGRKLDAAA